MESKSSSAEGEKKWSMSDALAEIGVLREQAMQGGGVDSESDELSRLIIDVRNSSIAPTEGVRLAHDLVAKRQESH